jgi:hypothetical protein
LRLPGNALPLLTVVVEAQINSPDNPIQPVYFCGNGGKRPLEINCVEIHQVVGGDASVFENNADAFQVTGTRFANEILYLGNEPALESSATFRTSTAGAPALTPAGGECFRQLMGTRILGREAS